MRTAWALCAAVALAVPAAAGAEEPAGEVAEVFGRAEVVRRGVGQAEALGAGQRVYAGDTVRTVGDSRAHLLFADGTFVQLAGETEVSVGEYAHGRKGGPLRGRIDLAVGKILLKLQKLAAGSTFSVDTGNAIAGVRGTEFAVAYRTAGGTPRTSVHVLTGEVGVLNKLGAGEAKVAENRWVELTGERIGPVGVMDRGMMNSIMVDFRAPSGLREGLRKPAAPAQGQAQAAPGQGEGSPEVGLRTQYISPKGLTVPPSQPMGAVVKPAPAAPASQPGGPRLQQTGPRGPMVPLTR